MKLLAKEYFGIRDGILNLLKDNLNDKSIKDLLKFIAKYIDDNSAEALLISGPWAHIYFLDSHRNAVFNFFNVNPRDIKKIIEESPVIMSNWMILNDQFNILMIVLGHHCLINKKEAEAKYILLFLLIRFYSSKQAHVFPHPPAPAVAEYTINHLSNKFKVKKLGTIYELLVNQSNTYFDTYRDLILNCSDDDIRIYIPGIESRLASLVGNIRTEFDKAWKSGAYLNTEEEIHTDDEFRTTTNVSNDILRIAVNVTNKIISSPVDLNIAKLAANVSQVSPTAIVNCINQLNEGLNEKIQELIILILQLYLSDGTKNTSSIKSMTFTTYCFNVYKKSNTVDENILRIKKILDDILT